MAFSVQRIFLFTFLSFILGAGIGLNSLLKGNFLFYLFLINIAFIFFSLSFLDRRLFFIGIFVVIFLLGFLRADTYQKNEKFFWSSLKIRYIDLYRQKILQAINENFFPPESEFIKGLLLGQESITDKKFKEDLNKTGTRHIVAISGFNMTIFAIILHWVFYFFGFSRKLSFFILSIFLIFYTIFVQAPPSAVRAMIMVLFTIGGRLIFSTSTPLNSLLITATIMILQNPEILIKDISFQFSFLSILGIILFAEKLELYFKKLKFPQFILSTISLSISAQLLLLPLLIYYFGGFSIISPLINGLVVPFSSFLLLISLFFGVFSITLPFLADIISFPMNIISSFIISSISFFAQNPISYINLNFQGNIIFVFFYYCIFIIFVLLFKNFRGSTS